MHGHSVKKEITNLVGENSDHKWALLRETGRGHRPGRFAVPLSDHFVTHDQTKLEDGITREILDLPALADAGLKRPGVSLPKGTNERCKDGMAPAITWNGVGLGIRTDSGIHYSGIKISSQF